MISKRKPKPQLVQATGRPVRPSKPSSSTDRRRQFGQMKYGTDES
jgi:hypothetical protein